MQLKSFLTKGILVGVAVDIIINSVGAYCVNVTSGHELAAIWCVPPLLPGVLFAPIFDQFYYPQTQPLWAAILQWFVIISVNLIVYAWLGSVIAKVVIKRRK